MKQFKIRASKAGVLLTNGRDRKSMGETAKSYLKEWVISEFSGKQKDIKSKYLDRGNALEADAIARVGRYYQTELTKNEEFLENEWFTGTFDARTSDRVIDTKVPFDVFTMPYFISEPDSDYYVQLQVYMNLTGLRKATLCYCLENGSLEQVERLSWQLAKEAGKDEPDIEEWDEAQKQLSYDHLPESKRIIVHEFEYNEELIEQLKSRVLEARNYIETELLTKLNK
jgi:hypothetical protein